MTRVSTRALFVILVVGGGLVIGFLTAPGQWYAALTKPPFNPPDWVFAPIWTLLYVLIAIAGWRTFERDRGGWPMKLWVLQLGLNFLWSPVFFAAHLMGLALAIVLLLLMTILFFIALSWRQDPPRAWLFVPYAIWVAFASLLNASLLLLNRP
ncbi:MAG: tryptophan-rich sensory protein [Alphaproteobacteria bacterium]|nr:tryptophan-rich sensory protein [Alphaproteobacteria bacterium]